jgi:sugar lactone lactonase YvrE
MNILKKQSATNKNGFLDDFFAEHFVAWCHYIAPLGAKPGEDILGCHDLRRRGLRHHRWTIAQAHLLHPAKSDLQAQPQPPRTTKLMKKFALFITIASALYAAITAQAQTTYEPYFFTTFAGNANGGNGTGSEALFYQPYSTATDSAGNVYVADTYNHTIRKITLGGVVTTLAGLAGNAGSTDGTGSDARFTYPFGVAADSTGNVYVADTYNFTIRKITSAGVVTTLAGSPGVPGSADGTGSAAQFYYPQGVAVDSAGNVYVGDTQNQTIRTITPGGVVTTLAGSAGVIGFANGTGSAAQFNYPGGVAVDSAGNVYVADTNNHTIRKITSSGAVTTLAGSHGAAGSDDGTGSDARFNYPYGVTADSVGNIYVADTNNQTIRKITSAGVVTTLAGSPGVPGSADGTGSAAQFYQPNGVAVDSAGNLYVADTNNSTIRKITPAAVVTTFAGSVNNAPGGAGSVDGTGRAARFYNPEGVAVDSAGNVYVADTYNHTIRQITSAGVVTTLAGSPGVPGSADGTGSAAQFNYPFSVAVDSAGNVYVADNNNHTIRKITSGGVVTTLAGSAGAIGFANGTGSAARFNYPGGVAVDSAGNIYVADTYNHTIRQITSAGVVTTLAGSHGAAGSADGTGSDARFYYPYGVAADSAGNVYVADSYNGTIRKITSAAVVTTLAGSAGVFGSADGTGSAAQFNYPYGVAADSAGNIYVADTSNYTIRKITSAGVVTTLAGLPASYGIADGTGSDVRFNYPFGVAVDSAGNIFVADTYNSEIRVGETPIQLLGAVSRKMHGTLGPFDVTLPLTGSPGIECRGTGGTHTLVFTLNHIVTSGSAMVTSGAGTPGAASFSGNTMTVPLSGVTNVQTITLTLSNVTDHFSQVLPNAAVNMGVLLGDVNANRVLTNADVSLVKAQVAAGGSVTASNFRDDVNANGGITNADVSVTKAQVAAGAQLP